MINLHLQNVNLTSNSGPNCFGRKLFESLKQKGVTFDSMRDPLATLAFIHKTRTPLMGTLFQRLDGIYFNSDQNYRQQNKPILETYKLADGVIFQSEFNRKLITKYFGEHDYYTVIPNGSNFDLIAALPTIPDHIRNKYGKIWCCASHWRPHKRLRENIEYFLEHSEDNDIMFVVGKTTEEPFNHHRVKYLGELKYENLLTILKAADYFIHLAWLDHCPNVVVDARSCGSQVICSSSGGTKEIAGNNALVIQEEEWDFSPVKLYEPPLIDYSKKKTNTYNSNPDMKHVSESYLKFMMKDKK